MKVDESEIEALLALDGARFEMAAGFVVEFTARRTDITPQRPHGLSYALVFRQLGVGSLVRFDNAHAVARHGGRYVKPSDAFDHWHRTAKDRGRPYTFVSAMKLLDDFWLEVKRTLDGMGIAHDL
jgi:Family of unknown function (DUF6516)